MTTHMDFTCPDDLPTESNGEETLLPEDDSEVAKGVEAEHVDDELLESGNLDSHHMAELPEAKPSYSSWITQSSKPAIITGVGLENLGNTCFLNSVMQCFIHTVPLLQGILSDKHSNCDKEMFCIICALRELINLSLTWRNRHVSPISLVNNLSYFSSGFQRFQQEDAHEFLQCFLDRLESCHNSTKSDDNIVNLVFGGRLVSKLKCCSCGHCSDTYEPSIDLSLEIENVDNLLTALQSFTKVEKIEDPETKFTCEECKEQVAIEKQLSYDQAPSVAVFQLKRFKNDGCLVQKIDKHVAFPLELDLVPFTAGAKESDIELKYQLYAVIVHVGWTSTSGHYYCFVRLSPNVWCKFDDSRVVLVTEEYVLSQEAYLLFYAKEGTSWFTSFIETQTFFSVDSNAWNTSPKSVLDTIDTMPETSNTEDKLSNDYNSKDGHGDIGQEDKEVENNIEIEDSVIMQNDLHRIITTSIVAPQCAGSSLSSGVASPKPHEGVSPTLPEKLNSSEEVGVSTNFEINTSEKTPLRSPSPEIYREDPPDAGFSIPRGHLKTVERIACKRRLEKDMDDLETRQAYSFIKKSMHGSRGQQMLAALRGSKSEPSVNRKKVRKLGQDGSNIRHVVRPLVAGSRR